MSYIIVGLGNPGAEYENTRHNAGRMMLLAFAKANDFSEWELDKKLKALVSTGKLATGNPPERAENVTRQNDSVGLGSVRAGLKLVLPETFMNKSGEIFKKLETTNYKLKTKNNEIPNLVVLHDDLDIPFGKFKISWNKSSGGHQGVESIIKTVKTQAFVRVRIGICPHSSFPKRGAGGGGFKLKKPHSEDLINKFILDKFKPDELAELKKLYKKVSEALAVLVTEGREVAMSRQGSYKS